MAAAAAAAAAAACAAAADADSSSSFVAFVACVDALGAPFCVQQRVSKAKANGKTGGGGGEAMTAHDAQLLSETKARAARCIDRYMEQVFEYGQAWHVILEHDVPKPSPSSSSAGAAVAVAAKPEQKTATTQKKKKKIEEEETKLETPSVLISVLCADYYVAREDMGAAQRYLALARTQLARLRTHVDELKEDKEKSLSSSSSSSSFLKQALARETLYVAIWTQWLSGHLQQAFDSCCAVLRDTAPSDLFCAKRAQLIAFIQGSRTNMLRPMLIDGVAAACSKRRYYHGMLGFALEQCDRLREAEAAGKAGTALFERDPWAHHCVAHALYGQGKLDEGIAWMRKHEHLWTHCMSFMYTHNWFHVALFELDKMNFARVLQLFAANLWPKAEAKQKTMMQGSFLRNDKRNTQDQINAIGALALTDMRLKRCVLMKKKKVLDKNALLAAQAAVTAQWRDVSTYLRVPPVHHFDTLHDVLVVYALGRVGRLADQQKMLTSMRSFAASQPTARREQLERVCLPLAEAIVAHAPLNLHGGGGGDSAYIEDSKLSKDAQAAARKAMQLRDGLVIVPGAEDAKAAVSSSNSSTTTTTTGSSIKRPLTVVGGSNEQLIVFNEFYYDVLLCCQRADLVAPFLRARLQQHCGDDDIKPAAALPSAHALLQSIVE
jgi:hypothetical protein